MKVEVDRTGSASVLTLTGRLSIGGGDAVLRREFRQLLDGGERRFVLDLRGLSSADSAGLGEIIACHKQAQATGGIVRLVVNRSSRVYEFFETAQLSRVLEMFDAVDDALAALPGH